MKIYTKTGDAGDTRLFSGQKVRKNHLRVIAYGTVDELNSQLGVALAAAPAEAVRVMLAELQPLLFELGSDLATVLSEGKPTRIDAGHITMLEGWIDEMTAALPPLRAFIMPGGTPAAAALHVARTICRRAEREAIAAAAEDSLPADALVFLNRLSDFLFTLARWENHLQGRSETEWVPQKKA